MKGQTNRSILQPKLQRRLRHTSTDAERLLWRRLRGQQLDGCKFRRQHPFGNYIVDFACLDRMLVVELDGSQHAEQTREDAARSLVLERAGFQVLRFWNNQIFQDMEGVLETIWKALRARVQTHPHPGPPLEGEGEQRGGALLEGRREPHPHPGPPLEGEGEQRGGALLEGRREPHPYPRPPLEGEGEQRGGVLLEGTREPHRHPRPPLEGEGAKAGVK